MNHILSSPLLLALMLSAAQAGGKSPSPVGKESAPPPAPPLGHWKVSLGASYRSLGGISFDTGSYAPSFRLPSLGRNHQGFPNVGSVSDYGDRSYDDGYVFKDGATGNPQSFAPDSTWNWGYRSGSQVSGDSLNFHASSSNYSSNSSIDSNQPGGWSEDVEGLAPELALAFLFDLKPHFRLGPSLALSILTADSAHSGSNLVARQSWQSGRTTVSDSYPLDGIVAPGAPYSGTYGGPGPVINNKPGSRNISRQNTGRGSREYANQIRESLDLDLYTFSLGASMELDITPTLFLTLGTGLALNVADTDAAFSEELTVSRNGGKASTVKRWEDQQSELEVLPGFYVQAGLGYQFHPQWSVSAYGRYDWSDSVSGQVGPSTYEVDLSGWSVGAALSWMF